MKLLKVLIFGLFTSFIFAQNNYYVATTGVNSNNGSIANPWKDIQYGCNQLVAGDTLNIRSGSYFEKIDLDVSGSPNNYITIRNYQDESVVIDAINFNDDIPIIWTDNAYLQIKGLHLTNNIYNYASGLALQGGAHHIEIIDNKISNIKFSADPNATVTSNTNAVPLSVYADSAIDSLHTITIRNNEVFNNQTGYSENIAAGGNFSHFSIENNTVHDNTNIGIDIGGNYQVCPDPALDHGRHGVIRNNLVYNCNSPYSPAAGIYIDGGHAIIVENNVCHHNGYGGEIGCEENGTTERIVFRNNIFYANFYAGMHVGAYDVNTTGNVLESAVYNNTFYQNDIGFNTNGELLLTKSENTIVENNIFYTTSQNVLLYGNRTQTNFNFDYNLIYALAGMTTIETTINGANYVGLQNYYTATGQGANAIFSNPLFTDAANQDFHITTNSLAINGGNPAYSISNGELDIDGEARIDNTIIDCGADEYYFTASIDEIGGATKNKFFPNPTTNNITVSKSLNTCLYQVFNIQGKLVGQGTVVSNKISLEKLPKAIYILQIKGKKQIYSYKVVLQ